MSTDGVLGAVWLPTDGWLDPSGLANALAAGARQRGAQIRTADPRRRDRHGARPGDRRHRRAQGRTERDPRRRRRQRRRHVRAGDRPAGRRDRADHPDGPPVPLHRADRGRPPGPAAAARPRQPRLLPRGGRRAVHGRLRARPGSVVARRRPARLQRQAPGARHGRASSRSWRAPSGASRRWPTRASTGSSTAPRGSPRTTSSSSANRRSAGSSSPPGSRPTASPARAASVARWRRGSSTASPSSTSGRWTSGGSGRPIAARRTRWRGRSRTTRPTTTSTTRTRSARPAARCGWRRPTTMLAGLGASFGEKSGWERPNWFESNARRRRRGAPAARLGRRALVARDRRRGAGDARARPACSTRRSFAKLEIVGPGAVAFLQRLCANDVDVPVGRIVYTQLLNRRGGIECDLTVTRVTADRYLFITGTAFGQHDLAWLRRHLPDDGSVLLNDITSGRVCFALWGPRARDILGSAHARRRLRRRLPVPHRARDHRRFRAGLRVARHLRRRARLGAVRAHRVRSSRCGGRCGTRAGRTAWSPAATGRSTRSGSRRAIASGRATSRRTRRRTRPGSGSRSRSTRGPSSSGARRWSRPRRPGPRKRLRCLVLDDPRSVCLGNEPVRLGGEIVGPGDVRRLRVRGRALDRVRLPAAGRAAIGTRGEVEVFGEWIGFEVAREPLYDPEGARIRS